MNTYKVVEDFKAVNDSLISQNSQQCLKQLDIVMKDERIGHSFNTKCVLSAVIFIKLTFFVKFYLVRFFSVSTSLNLIIFYSFNMIGIKSFSSIDSIPFLQLFFSKTTFKPYKNFREINC